MIKVATLSAIVLISLIALVSVIGAKGCDPACYSRAGLWTDKCYVDDCDDCHPCNYMIPNKTTDVRSPCPAFNTLANHGVISRDGKCINGTDAVEKFQTYFGCQMETCMLVLTQNESSQNSHCYSLVLIQSPYEFATSQGINTVLAPILFLATLLTVPSWTLPSISHSNFISLIDAWQTTPINLIIGPMVIIKQGIDATESN